MSMTKTEREILEECAGLRTPRPRGVAISVCLEYLQDKTYLTRDGRITLAGLRALKGKEIETETYTPKETKS